MGLNLDKNPLVIHSRSSKIGLLIDLSSVPNGDNNDDEFAVIELLNSEVVADANPPGGASFLLLTTRWP